MQMFYLNVACSDLLRIYRTYGQKVKLTHHYVSDHWKISWVTCCFCAKCGARNKFVKFISYHSLSLSTIIFTTGRSFVTSEYQTYNTCSFSKLLRNRETYTFEKNSIIIATGGLGSISSKYDVQFHVNRPLDIWSFDVIF